MMSSSRLRRWHAYLGLFIAPSVLFFALTGALQIFGLHEAHGSYRPAVLIEKLSAIHKDQIYGEPHHHPAADGEPSSAPQAAGSGGELSPGDDEDKVSASTLALKWFCLGVSLALIISTLLGVWMGTTQIGRKSIAWTLLIAGTLVPMGLLAI